MTLHFAQALLPDGWADNVRLELEGDRIARVQVAVPPQPGDARHGIGLPGLCNLHSHAFQRGMAGLSEVRGPQADSFWTWREVMYRFLGAMTPDDVEAVTAQAFAEMLEGGFTRVGEFHYLHHDFDGRPYANVAEMAERVAAAAAATGIGLTLLPVFYAQGGFGAAPPTAGQRRFVCGVDSFADLFAASRAVVAALPGATLGLAPHSLRAVTPEQFSALLPLLPQGPVHIHAAEQVREVEECLAWSGARPVQWLLDHAPVDTRWCLVHATHMTADELRRLAATGAVAGLCPLTEASLGDGIFAGADWREAEGYYGIGTDSNIQIDAAAELRQLEYGQRLALRARNVMADAEGQSIGGSIFRPAQTGGARALAVRAEGLAAGAAADIVALDDTAPSIAGRHGDAALDGWIFASARPAIAAVWVGSQQVVSDGRHKAAEAIRARYMGTVERLYAA